MSFRLQPTPPARPNRCQLFGPGSRTALFEKMAASAADVINLDLEDSVAPDDKPQARANIIEAINDIEWQNKHLSVRINGLDTPYWYRDVVDILEQAGDRIDQIMIPKVGNAADIYAVDALVTAIEAAKTRTKPIALEVIIESAAGLAHVEDIARKPPSWPPAAPMASCPSMAPLAISPTTKATAPKPAAPPPWAWSANGRSTPNKSRSPTRSSPPPRHKSPRPAKSSPQCSKPKPMAKAPPSTKAASSTSPPSNKKFI